MEDSDIIALYWKRDETAVSETKKSYGNLLQSIAWKILKNHEDAEECENDTYVKTWNAIPPEKPNILSAFLSRITRNLSLDLYEKKNAEKRGGGEVPLMLEELAECIGDPKSFDAITSMTLKDILNRFLSTLTQDARIIFLRRYWFGDSVEEISKNYGYGKSKVKMSLLRSRNALKKILETEDLWYGA